MENNHGNFNENLMVIHNATRRVSRGGLNVFRNVTDRMADYFTEDDSTLEIKTLSYDLNSMVRMINHFHNFGTM